MLDEQANRPPSTRTGGGGGDDRIEELEELVAAAEAQARQAGVFLADSKAESARANSDAAQLKVSDSPCSNGGGGITTTFWGWERRMRNMKKKCVRLDLYHIQCVCPL